MMKPHFEALAREYGDRIRVLAVNVEESPEIAEELKVFSIPTVVVFRGGGEVARRSGAQSEADLRTLFDAVADEREIPAMSGKARLVRIVGAVVLSVIAGQVQPGWPLQIASALLFVSAIHDRCPIIQALKRPFLRSSSET